MNPVNPVEKERQMFGKKAGARKPECQITSLIGVDTRIEGHIHFQGGLQIDGHVTGNVTASGAKPSKLVLSEGASVEGEIRVPHVIINGSVVGPIHSYECLVLLAQAKVRGSIYYRKIDIHLGATINGKAQHMDDKQPGIKLVTLKLASESEETILAN
jgi:cytoskeletal protein CcmA (bactofilin family)